MQGVKPELQPSKRPGICALDLSLSMIVVGTAPFTQLNPTLRFFFFDVKLIIYGIAAAAARQAKKMPPLLRLGRPRP
jgi:hypothetical protein